MDTNIPDFQLYDIFALEQRGQVELERKTGEKKQSQPCFEAMTKGSFELVRCIVELAAQQAGELEELNFAECFHDCFRFLWLFGPFK